MSDALMNKHIVLTGLPAGITPAKRERFLMMFTKKVATVLDIDATTFKVKFLLDDDSLAIGAILEFARLEDSSKALVILNGLKFTKTDTFKVNAWSDFKKHEDYAEEYEEVEIEEDSANTTDIKNPFLMDKMARPQFIIKGGKTYDTEWFWFNTEKGKPELYRKPSATKDDNLGQWTEMDRGAKKLQRGAPKPFPMWSPRGSFLLTQHHSGLKIWGGPTMNKIGELLIPAPKAVQISPNEKYIVILGKELSVFDVQTSKHLRDFKGLDVEMERWPIAKFNADDTVVAIQTRDDRLNLYETSTMKMLAGTTEKVNYTIEVPGLKNFEWSPINPLHIAYVVEGSISAGWKVSIDNVFVDDMFVTLESLGRRNFFNTANVNFLWHPNGQFTAAKITKSNNNVEYCIFRVGSKTATAEQLEVKVGMPNRFSWQPDAAAFCISTVGVGAKKSQIHFYGAQKLGFKLIQSFDSEADGLFFSPKGGRLAAVSFARSFIELYAVSNDLKNITQIGRADHGYVTNVEWDPTGRFFVSFTSSLKHELDNRYQIFDVNCVNKIDQKMERLSHISWRPLPPSMLSEDELAQIKKELPQRSAKYTADAQEEQRKKDEAEDDKKAKESKKYIEIMEAIHKDAVQKKFAEKREAARLRAPYYKRHQDLLAARAHETTSEVVTTEMIESETQV